MLFVFGVFLTQSLCIGDKHRRRLCLFTPMRCLSPSVFAGCTTFKENVNVPLSALNLYQLRLFSLTIDAGLFKPSSMYENLRPHLWLLHLPIQAVPTTAERAAR